MPGSPDEFPMAVVADLCRRYQVHELALFGSAARDDAGSDGRDREASSPGGEGLVRVG